MKPRQVNLVEHPARSRTSLVRSMHEADEVQVRLIGGRSSGAAGFDTVSIRWGPAHAIGRLRLGEGCPRRPWSRVGAVAVGTHIGRGPYREQGGTHGQDRGEEHEDQDSLHGRVPPEDIGLSAAARFRSSSSLILRASLPGAVPAWQSHSYRPCRGWFLPRPDRPLRTQTRGAHHDVAMVTDHASGTSRMHAVGVPLVPECAPKTRHGQCRDGSSATGPRDS